MSLSWAPPVRLRCRTAASCAADRLASITTSVLTHENRAPLSMARFRRHRETDGTRAVVSFNNVLAHAAGSEGLGFDTLVLDSRTRSRRSLSARLCLAAFRGPLANCHRYAMRRHRVRAFVARSAGGPPWPCDPRGSTNQRCVRPTSAQSSNPSGTLIRSASALPLVAEGNRCGRRFHDAVARFSGQPGLLRRAFSSHGA
jgi:hypothetical protein